MLEDIMLQSERKRIVNTALLRLPENMRIAVHLVYFDGLAYEEAAKVMKKSRKQIDKSAVPGKKHAPGDYRKGR